MIVDYKVVVLYLKSLLQKIKKIGIYKFFGASLIMLGLIYFTMHLADKDINIDYIIGLLIVTVLTLLSYRTFNMLIRRDYNKKSLVAWLMFILQLLSSPFVLLFVMRLFNSRISCYAFSKNALICKNAILMEGNRVFHLPDVGILVIINLVSFLLIQIISRINLAEHEYIPIS